MLLARRYPALRRVLRKSVLIPAALVDSYEFWQTSPNSLAGYPRRHHNAAASAHQKPAEPGSAF